MWSVLLLRSLIPGDSRFVSGQQEKLPMTLALHTTLEDLYGALELLILLIQPAKYLKRHDPHCHARWELVRTEF